MSSLWDQFGASADVICTGGRETCILDYGPLCGMPWLETPFELVNFGQIYRHYLHFKSMVPCEVGTLGDALWKSLGAIWVVGFGLVTHVVR